MSAMAPQITGVSILIQPFVQVQMKENAKASHYWLLWGEFTGDRWILRTKGHWRGKIFHWMTSSWLNCSPVDIFVATDSAENHDDVIKWKDFPRHWPFMRGIHGSPVNSPHKGQWRGTLMFSLICVWINGWVNNGEAVDLRRHRAHFDVTAMLMLVVTTKLLPRQTKFQHPTSTLVQLMVWC